MDKWLPLPLFLEGNIISKPLQNSGGGLEWSNDGERFSSNDSITCLNIFNSIMDTEGNTCGIIAISII